MIAIIMPILPYSSNKYVNMLTFNDIINIKITETGWQKIKLSVLERMKNTKRN